MNLWNKLHQTMAEEEDAQIAPSASGIQTKRGLQLQLQEAKLNQQKEHGLTTSLREVAVGHVSLKSFCPGMRGIGILLIPSSNSSVGDQVVALKVLPLNNL